MKALFNAILDGITFKDIAGKRQPRTYVMLTGFILFLIFLLASCVALERNAMMDDVRGTPQALQISLEPVATEILATETAEPCPTNPADWTFVEVLPGDNFQRIAESCVYDGLAKSVAWALAVREGYPRAEATNALGFAEAPLRRLDTIMTLTNTKGPLTLALTFTPPHPDFAEWRVSNAGEPAISYGLRGCFRTVEIVGNQARSWNTDYSVICVLSEDSRADQVVTALDGHIYTADATPTRSFSLFGYVGDGGWAWLGTQQEPRVALAQLDGQGADAREVAEQYGAALWDASWLSEQMNLPARELPEGWQNARNESDLQAILAGLNAYLLGEQP